MKKILFPILAIVLAVGLALPMAAPATADSECSVELFSRNVNTQVNWDNKYSSYNNYYGFTDPPDGTYAVSETLKDGRVNFTPTSYEITLGHGVVVSDNNTLVTSGNVPGPPQYPYNAVEAWTHPAWAGTTASFSASGAEWIWESYEVVHPIEGDVVTFERSFNIPGTPTGGTLRITADNIYTVTLNNIPIGSNADWVSVESYKLSSTDLKSGNNLLQITATNLDTPGSTPTSNPGGLIYELSYEFSIADCSISGHKYLCDESGECTEEGLEGWTINLTGPVSANTTTDSNGYYEFLDLPDGTYTISEELKPGWEACTPTSYEITLGHGVVASDNNTLVTSGNVPGATYSYNAIYAWEAWDDPPDTQKSHWDNGLNYDFSPSGADWIWENYRVVHPIAGDIVEFERSFYIPGTSGSGTLYITCDNGYEVYLNGTFIGSAQLGAGWETSNLTQSFVDTTNWQSVESYDASGLLQSGNNTLVIEAANEYMGPPEQSNGTEYSNPAGLIYELSYEFTTSEINFYNRESNTCPEEPGSRTLGFYKNHPCVVEQVLPITIDDEEVSDVDRAIEIIKDRGTHWSRLRSQLFVTMLNVAVFGIGDCTLEYLGLEGDQTVNDIIAQAEALLADPNATKDELSAMQDLLDRINNSNDDAPLPEDIAQACPPGGGPPKTPPGKKNK